MKLFFTIRLILKPYRTRNIVYRLGPTIIKMCAVCVDFFLICAMMMYVCVLFVFINIKCAYAYCFYVMYIFINIRGKSL
jgi:hypothetical protein